MNMEKTDNKLLTPAQAAQILKVSTRQLKYWRCPKSPVRIPFIKLGHRSIRYRKTDVEAFINQQTITNNGESE